MAIVNGLGEIMIISDPDDLKAFRINLGLLGKLIESYGAGKSFIL